MISKRFGGLTGLATVATLLVVLLAGCGAFAVSTSALPDAARNVAYTATLGAAGAPTPYTWSVSAGTLPAGLSLNGSTGRITGTPTTLGTTTFTVKVVSSDNKSATAGLSIAVVTPGTWPQVGKDPGRRSFAGAELALTPANAAGVHQEWAVPTGVSAPVTSGGLVYVNGILPDTSDRALMAFDQSNGALAWSVQLAQTCTVGRIAVSATAVFSACGAGLEAFRLAAPHDRLWTTVDTDPGVNPTDLLLDGGFVVASDYQSVIAYDATTGERQWQQPAANGGNVQAVAAAPDAVVVASTDRVTAYGLSDGSFHWEHPVTLGGPTVVADGWVYVADAGVMTRYSLGTGVQGWKAKADPNGSSAVAAYAVDGTTLYSEWDIYGEFDVTRVIRALHTNNGTLAWETQAADAIESIAIVGDLLWVTTSARGFSDFSSELTAYKPADGSSVTTLNFAGRSYQPTAFANGHALMVNNALTSVGLNAPTPVITTKVLKSGRVGSAYSEQLAATVGTTPYRWTVAAGTLPAGVVLSTAGALTGTPTGAGSPSITFRVTDTKNATSTRQIVVQVSPSGGTSAWGTGGHDATRNATNADEAAVGLANVQQVANRWKTAAYGASDTPIGYPEPISVGGKLFETGRDGVLRAWTATGTGTNRVALWSASADTNERFVSGPTESGGTIYVVGSDHAVYAVRASDGIRLRRTVTDADITGDTSTAPSPLVSGSTVVVTTNHFPQDELWAVHATTGALLWGGTSRAMVPTSWYYPGQDMATDGTRLYFEAACRVYAMNLSDGSAVWDRSVLFSATDTCVNEEALTGVVYSGGTVYAGALQATAAFDGATGALKWRTGQGTIGGASVSNGALVTLRIAALTDFGWSLQTSALDLRTGSLLWASDADPSSSPSVAGDLVFATDTNGDLRAYDIRSGARKLDINVSTFITNMNPRAVVAAGRIFVVSADGTIRALGPP